MIATILALSISIISDPSPAELEAFRSNLSATTREELGIVEKIKSLRTAIEKLPSDWKASGIETQAITKESLIAEIEDLELSAAARWSVLLTNTAYLDRVADPKAFAARRELSSMNKLQADVSKQIEQVNFKMKDGVLLNLASKVMMH